ncbi:Lipoprotein [Flavobacterium longum]|uniref:hypothetical protein n=1 Tax=Flavobacterium longum TaxID=1299340 RepID=UPI0039E7FC03
MKTKNVLLGLSLVAISFTGCKSEEEKQAEKTVDTYSKYVDSVSNVAAEDAKKNWEAIDAEYTQKTNDAEAALANLKDREKAEERINASKAKYEEMKAKYSAEMEQEMAAADPKAKLRGSFFPGQEIGEDLDFSWVNKDNILKAYNDFNNAYDANKANYSREDFDEVKKIWEALDARKNTVEKEGLSSADNLKIAELKVKWSTAFKVDRLKAKGDENQAAKDKAN